MSRWSVSLLFDLIWFEWLIKSVLLVDFRRRDDLISLFIEIVVVDDERIRCKREGSSSATDELLWERKRRIDCRFDGRSKKHV